MNSSIDTVRIRSQRNGRPRNSGQLARQDLKSSCATKSVTLICRGLRYCIRASDYSTISSDELDRTYSSRYRECGEKTVTGRLRSQGQDTELEILYAELTLLELKQESDVPCIAECIT